MEVDAHGGQDLGRHALSLSQEAQEDVLRAHVVHSQVSGLPHGHLQHPLAPGREGQVHGLDLGLPSPHGALHPEAHVLQGDGGPFKYLKGHPLPLGQKAHQEVFRAYDVVSQGKGFPVRQLHHSLSPFGKKLPHGGCPFSRSMS